MKIKNGSPVIVCFIDAAANCMQREYDWYSKWCEQWEQWRASGASYMQYYNYVSIVLFKRWYN